MRRFLLLCLTLVALYSAASATTFRFDTDPFAGSNVQNVPGRQVVGGEFFINFNVATDKFQFESSVFGAGDTIQFANALAQNLPATDVNVVVLDTFDNDNNPLTPFGAGNAADLIAGRVTTPGAGFFIYFNQSLDIPRLVYSTDLSSNTADLRILARILNLNGDIGRNTMPQFRVSNFEFTNSSTNQVPEPASILLLTSGGLAGLLRKFRRK